MISNARVILREDDLDAIEKEMKKIIKKGAKIERFTKSREDAIAFFKEKNEPYKVELIEDLPEGERNLLLFTGRLDRSLRRTSPYERKRRQSIQASLLPVLTGEETRRTQC